MMISAHSPKQTRRHMAKVAMSNSFDMSDNSMTTNNALLSASKTISMPNNHENDYYDLGQASSESFVDEASKISFSNANFESNLSFGGLKSSAAKKDSSHQVISGSLYKKRHVDSKGFLPKPDTSTLIKSIDKKLNGENLVPILIVSKSRKVLKNKISQSKAVDLNESNPSHYSTGSGSASLKKRFDAHNILIDDSIFNQSGSQETINNNDYFSKSISNGSFNNNSNKSIFHSKSTVIFDDKNNYGDGKSQESAKLRARHLYRKYKEKVKH